MPGTSTDPAFLLEIYQTQVRPHLEYAAQVWDPHLLKDINHLESVQKFALKMSTKQRDGVPSLKTGVLTERCALFMV